MNQKRYFGTDGIRGLVGQAPMTEEWVYRLGRAVGQVIPLQAKPILIGQDTRESSEALVNAVASGLAAQGHSIILGGVMPTPAVAFLCRQQNFALGVVVSASHNPYHDNGIKFFGSDGFKLSDEAENAIEIAIDNYTAISVSAQSGCILSEHEVVDTYVQHAVRTFFAPQALAGLELVLDCAHGATYQVAPAVFEALGATVYPLHVNPDGRNINADCGATHLSALQKAVKEYGVPLGIAFDGDGDRLMMVDAASEIVDGDELLWILATHQLAQHQALPGVVGTLMSNLGLVEALSKCNIPFYRANVGDRYVLESLQQKQWFLGGESSGHLLHLHYSSTGDGLISALLILQAMLRAQKPLSELKKGMYKYPQVMINVRYEGAKLDLKEAAVQNAVLAVEQNLGTQGRVLLRASGTEPLIRVMVEAKEESLAKTQSQFLADRIQTILAAR